MLAGLSYPFWFVVVPFVMFSARREEPFVQFHARQSLWLGIGSLVTTVAGAFLCWAFMSVMPSGAFSGLMGVGAFVALWVVFLFMFFLFFFLGYRASAGEFYRLPVVGEKAFLRTLYDLGLTTADLEATGPVVRELVAPPAPPAPSLEAVSPPPALAELRPPSSVRTGPPLRPMPSTLPSTKKTWEPSAAKSAEPSNVLKRWLTDEEAR